MRSVLEGARVPGRHQGSRAAPNNQNRITRIDLERARFLRPQLVCKAATDEGYGFATASELGSISNILDTVYRQRISYEAIKVLYFGFFGRAPSNMWKPNCSEMRMDVLEGFAGGACAPGRECSGAQRFDCRAVRQYQQGGTRRPGGVAWAGRHLTRG